VERINYQLERMRKTLREETINNWIRIRKMIKAMRSDQNIEEL